MPSGTITQDRYDEITDTFVEMQELLNTTSLPAKDRARLDELLHDLVNGGMQDLAAGYEEALRLRGLRKV